MTDTPRQFIAGDIVRVKGFLHPYSPESVGIVCARSDHDFEGMVGVRQTQPPALQLHNYPAARLILLEPTPRPPRRRV